MPETELSKKHQAFVNEYIIDLNATQAAIRAGYSKKTAQQVSSRMLLNVVIKEAVQHAMDARTVRTQVTADRVLSELAKLGYSNIEDYVTIGDDGLPTVDFSDLTREQFAAITEVTVETRREHNSDKEDAATIEKVRFKLADKRAALVDIGRHLKLFTDKVEHSGTIGCTVLQDDVDALTN